jgi:hypothetical protein
MSKRLLYVFLLIIFMMGTAAFATGAAQPAANNALAASVYVAADGVVSASVVLTAECTPFFNEPVVLYEATENGWAMADIGLAQGALISEQAGDRKIFGRHDIRFGNVRVNAADERVDGRGRIFKAEVMPTIVGNWHTPTACVVGTAAQPFNHKETPYLVWGYPSQAKMATAFTGVTNIGMLFSGTNGNGRFPLWVAPSTVLTKVALFQESGWDFDLEVTLDVPAATTWQRVEFDIGKAGFRSGISVTMYIMDMVGGESFSIRTPPLPEWVLAPPPATRTANAFVSVDADSVNAAADGPDQLLSPMFIGHPASIGRAVMVFSGAQK